MSHERHISRKELKSDQIRETIVHGAEAALSHQKQIWIFGGGILLVLALVLGWRFYSERQTVTAAAAFDDAHKVFQARIRVPGEPETPGEPSYVDETNKFTDAARKFSEVADKYSGTRPGKLAMYYAGLSYERLSKFDDAQNWLKKAERAGDAELASLARFRQAQIFEKTGKGDEAVKLYQALMAAPTTMTPKPLVMLTLGDYYRKSNPAEAQKMYTQIRAEFPESEAARVAQDRLEMIGQS